jgi:hypothetical protein
MRSSALILILIAMLFAAAGASQAQSTSSSSERISKLREEIAKRETADTPADLAELNRSVLIQRRAELRTLLLTEISKLQKHSTDLGSFITPEEAKKISDLVQSYTAEVNRLGSAMQQDLASSGGGGTGGSVDAATSGSSSAPLPTTPVVAATVVPATPVGVVSAGTTESNESLNCDEVNSGSKASSEVDKIICGLARDIPERRAFRHLAANTIDLGGPNRFSLIKILIAKKLTPTYLVEASEARLDKQVGASTASGDSTSLVTHGGTPAILGFAVERGALTQTTNDTAITFRGNPVGVFNALKNNGFIEGIKKADDDPLLRFLKKTSFAFTFNTDRGPQSGVFTGSSQQLSSVSARIELINKRTPSLYVKDWENFLATKAQPLVDTINAAAFIDPANQQWIDPALQSWFEQTQAKLATTSDADVSGVLQAALNELPIDNLRPETILLLQRIEQAMGAYMAGRDRIVDKINHGTVLTFEYLNKREINEPDTSNFTFIAEKGTKGGKVDFTFNGSLTIFNNMTSLRNFVLANPTLPQPRRVRDFQFAGQFDVPLGNVREFGRFVLFGAGRYERLLEDATTDRGQILPNTKGDIAYLQLGLKIPVAKSGFKIPVSVTFANRTELVKEKTVKGNFGFSFDLDTLFSKFKPFQ